MICFRCFPYMIMLAVSNFAITLHCRCVIADSAFASYRLAVALLSKGLHLIGNVKTAMKGFPKEKLNELADVRDKTAFALTEVTLESGEKKNILAIGDRDKKPMTTICTAGTSAGPVVIRRRVRTIHKDGRAKVRLCCCLMLI